MTTPRCIIPPVAVSEGQRIDAKNANAIYCNITTAYTVGTTAAFKPKFTTAAAYMAYKRACTATQGISSSSSSPGLVEAEPL